MAIYLVPNGVEGLIEEICSENPKKSANLRKLSQDLGIQRIYNVPGDGNCAFYAFIVGFFMIHFDSDVFNDTFLGIYLLQRLNDVFAEKLYYLLVQASGSLEDSIKNISKSEWKSMISVLRDAFLAGLKKFTWDEVFLKESHFGDMDVSVNDQAFIMVARYITGVRCIGIRPNGDNWDVENDDITGQKVFFFNSGGHYYICVM
jgi:hypothetical protein